jgi:Uncharacterized conserved protein
MMTERPSHLIDPVCGMTVEVARAESAGLLVDQNARTVAFCGPGCRRAFVEEPAAYFQADERSPAMAMDEAGEGAHGHAELPVIDAGMHRWYESCSCCLSEAFPDIKAQLDMERAGATQTPVDARISEGAEAVSGA